MLGGGLVSGAVILIGGDPGIGKSTIALQALIHLAHKGEKVLYVSGEESLRQTRMRAQRLGNLPESLYILAETQIEAIIQEVKQLSPSILVIDSIQTMYTSELESAPGSVSQIRESSGRLIILSKALETATLVYRPCHQRRRYCRTPRARAYGGYGALFRRGSRAFIPDTARCKKPFWLHQ